MSNTNSPMGDSERLELIRSYLDMNPTHGRRKISAALNIPSTSVSRWLRKIKGSSQKPEEANAPKFTLETGRNDAVISSKSAQITSVEQLLKAANIDTEIWEIDKQVVNTYEVAMREPATTIGGAGDRARIARSPGGAESTLWTRGSNQPMHEQLYQVKVWLKRKSPLRVGAESLILRLENARPVLDIPEVRKIKLPHKRALEICIMDPHIGLLCQRPEADEPWDIDRAAGTIMASIDDLAKKAEGFGPFEEIFMPFGNDFVHCDNLEGTTTGGTNQPEAVAWHHFFDRAEGIAIEMVKRARKLGKKIYIYQIPGNHSRISDFTLARIIRAYFRDDPNVIVDASSSPYKFHRYGNSLIGYEHGHSVSPIRLAALMANERPLDFATTQYREWHLGDQHRKGSSNPAAFEEQSVSVEYIPGLTAPNEWHRLKAFNHQKRGAVAWVYDFNEGPIARFQHNIHKFADTLKQ